MNDTNLSGMHHNEQLIAFIATLLALVIVYCTTLWAASTGKLSSLEALGLGTITGGLIGVLRIPQQRQVTIDNPPNQPVPTTEAHATTPAPNTDEDDAPWTPPT